jgi:hypothetical protein
MHDAVKTAITALPLRPLLRLDLARQLSATSITWPISHSPTNKRNTPPMLMFSPPVLHKVASETMLENNRMSSKKCPPRFLPKAYQEKGEFLDHYLIKSPAYIFGLASR